MIKTVKVGGTWWTVWSPGIIYPAEGEGLSAVTVDSQGQITLRMEINEDFKLSGGQRIDFIIEDDGKVRVVLHC